MMPADVRDISGGEGVPGGEDGERLRTIAVGTATCGRSVGALEVLEALRVEIAELGLPYRLVEVGCLGHCYAEPLVTVEAPSGRVNAFGYLDAVAARYLLRTCFGEEEPESKFYLGRVESDGAIVSEALAARSALERRVVMENCGIVDPCSIDDYRRRGGYASLRRALALGPDDVIEEIARAGLRGRGGAGFPTGVKWRACREADGARKVVVCNADEGDPGSFVDRVIIESDPHAVLEGMLIAGYAVGACEGRVYVRAEYPLAVDRMRQAIEQARDAHLLGEGVCGTAFCFDVDVFEAAGAFVCGEETALLASMEGRRGEPRLRPPYPAERGFLGRPTVIDNVKTLAYVRHIIARGARWFKGIGTASSAGTAVFCLTGKVARPGLVEVPLGSTLRAILYDAGGGMVDLNVEKPGRETPNIGHGGYCTRPRAPETVFKAIQIGGPSGGFLPASALDLPVDFESLRDAGIIMGSGGMVVLSQDDCMVEMARYFLEFTQSESCGKCVPCRVGGRLMLDLLGGVARGEGGEESLEALRSLAAHLRRASACNLGRTASSPVITALRYFEDEFRAHVEQRMCPALVCRDLISYEFEDVGCMSACEQCSVVCEAITSAYGYDGLSGRTYRTHEIDDDLCVRCAICVDSCAGVNHRAVRKVTPAKRLRAGGGS